MNTVATSPGKIIGMAIAEQLLPGVGAVHLATRRARPWGTSSRNERSIQTAMGRFIAVYMTMSVGRLVDQVLTTVLAM